MVQYLPLLGMALLSIGFAYFSFLASRLLAPQRPTAAKTAPYESGIVPQYEPAQRFPVRFYLVAMIFIIFDIEIIFLYPWAVRYDALGLFGLVEMLLFAVAVFVSFVYLISNGALDWGPGRRRELEPRTVASTIRKVPNRPAGGSETPASAGSSVA